MTTSDDVLDPPAGFIESTNRGPFTSHNGPFFHKVDEDGGFAQGFRVLDRHCNGMGIAHGGLITAFADGLMGTAIWRATDTASVTVRLNADFLSIARKGDWVEGTAEVTGRGEGVVFVAADIRAGHRRIMNATGVFKLMDRHRKVR